MKSIYTSPILIAEFSAGRVVVLPTDTVYGVAGLLRSVDAVTTMYGVKRRDDTKAVGTVLAASITQVEAITGPLDHALLGRFWPGPVSIIIDVPDAYAYAHRGTGGLAFRVPADEPLRQLLERTGPIATSSANLQEQPPANTVAEAQAYFGDAITVYIDGGDRSGRAPSRIIKLGTDGSIDEIRA